jgi:hypothetical protein
MQMVDRDNFIIQIAAVDLSLDLFPARERFLLGLSFEHGNPPFIVSLSNYCELPLFYRKQADSERRLMLLKTNGVSLSSPH